MNMPRLKLTALAYLSATFIVVAGCQLSAFEQGTYFIYQLVDQSDASVIDNRLAVNSQLFAKAATAAAIRTSEFSEFEMDYTALGSTKSSGFEPIQTSNTGLKATSEASPFDLGTQESVSLF
jgi:hypothetical protein